jgi:small-conductance mechanosensitive channel
LLRRGQSFLGQGQFGAKTLITKSSPTFDITVTDFQVCSRKNYRNTLDNYGTGRITLAGIFSSLKKLTAFILFIVVLAAITILFFELFVAGPTNLPTFFDRLIDISLVFVFTLTALFFLRRIKTLLTPRIGIQVATILQFLSMGIAILIMSFIILGFFDVSLTTLLTSAGIITVTVGLIISTFVGGILSGALVFTTHQLKIGEDVMVNNVPGRVIDMTALVMRIRTDVGQITIPNSAVASGGVIITSVRKPEPSFESRLPYVVGDRVVTLYKNEEGLVKELTAFHTTILLDSGREITFLNNSVLSGAVPVAKILGTST